MTRTADQILDECFLEVRAKLLEVAATLDRVERAAAEQPGLSTQQQARREQVDAAIQICASEGVDRAERLQQLFSRPYSVDWRRTMQL